MDSRVETRLVVCSQAVALVAIVGELAIVMPRALVEPWLWIGLTSAMVLSLVVVLARSRKLGSQNRGPAFRRAIVWAPVIAVALTMPIVLSIEQGKVALDAVIAIALGSAMFAVTPAALGYVATERSLPESLREPDTRRWVFRPSAQQRQRLLLAWPLVTAALFWLFTGLATDGDCAVDGTCRSGVPHTFARFGGGRSGGSSMDWAEFAQNVGLFATLLPAMFLCASSRLRWAFAIYLALTGAWLMIAMIDQWGGMFGLKIWAQLDLLELGG
jgi:hypothetical protein